MRWTTRKHIFNFPRKTLVMGIVNVTPDSFSDGGHFLNSNTAVDHALKLADEGADILDIGGESTRPGAASIPVKEELNRVIPVINQLAKQAGLIISVDTHKPIVAKEAINAGASIVNDIGANNNNAKMWDVISKTKAGYICMHMKGTPRTMQKNTFYKDVFSDVCGFFHERLNSLQDHGISAEQIAIDPGIGFGKSLHHNIKLMSHLNKFNVFERPVLIGASRKSFIEKLLGTPVEKRLPASLTCAAWATIQGSHIIRAHDVAETVQAIRMTEALIENNNGTST
ncbi:MAG: dihydropteroate synthase [Verrucomicrobiota bacterium]|jgi:dihydropteroate synthase|nr:dihydropteroate synthase [Verrucomicrobiota bacterium]